MVDFFIENVEREEIENKRVLEVGSKYANGSIRPFIIKYLHPEEYIGVDISTGLYVDEVLCAENILSRFGRESFDVIITTEMVEHVKDWRIVMSNLKNVLKEGGLLILTTRSIGYPYHGAPYDFWRYEVEDMKDIFSDFSIELLEKDSLYPGIFLKATKPHGFQEGSVDNVMLHSMVLNRRINGPENLEHLPLPKKIVQLFIKTRIGIFSIQLYSRVLLQKSVSRL